MRNTKAKENQRISGKKGFEYGNSQYLVVPDGETTTLMEIVGG